MIFISNILLASLFFIILSGVYFLGEKIKGTSFVLNANISPLLRSMMEALIFGLLFLAIQALFTNIYSNTIPYMFLVGFMVIFLNRGILLSSISIIPGLLYFLIMKEHSDSFYMVLATAFSGALVFEISNYYLKEVHAKLITYSYLLVFSLISLFVSAHAMSNGLNINTFEYQMVPFIEIVFIDILFSYAIKFSISANILYESINFVYSTYYRDSLLYTILGTELAGQKISRGIFGVFNINVGKGLTDIQKDNISKKLLTKVKEEFPERTLLFKFDEERYAFFLSTKTLDNKYDFVIKNILFDINTYAMRINKKYQLDNGKSKRAYINIGISLYGKQSSSINELETFALYALEKTYLNNKEMVEVFNYSKYRKNINDVISVNQLDDLIGLDNYVLKFSPVFSLASKKTEYMFCEPENISESQFIDDIRSYMTSIGKINTFERYFSTEAVKAFKNKSGKFLIPFSSERISAEDFYESFANYLLLNEINGKDLVMIVRPNEIKDYSNFIKNYYKLGKIGITFAIFMTDDIPEKLENTLNPKYILLNGDEIISKEDVELNMEKGIEMIHININKDEAVMNSIDSGITNFGGNLFESNIFPTIFSKQSKIYLNKIIKGREK